MFAFEHQQEVAVPSLAPICRNVLDEPKLKTAHVSRPYQISADKLANLEPVRSDRELFSVILVFVSATNVFMSVDQEKPRSSANSRVRTIHGLHGASRRTIIRERNENNHILLFSAGRAVV